MFCQDTLVMSIPSNKQFREIFQRLDSLEELVNPLHDFCMLLLQEKRLKYWNKFLYKKPYKFDMDEEKMIQRLADFRHRYPNLYPLHMCDDPVLGERFAEKLVKKYLYDIKKHDKKSRF